MWSNRELTLGIRSGGSGGRRVGDGSRRKCHSQSLLSSSFPWRLPSRRLLLSRPSPARLLFSQPPRAGRPLLREPPPAPPPVEEVAEEQDVTPPLRLLEPPQEGDRNPFPPEMEPADPDLYRIGLGYARSRMTRAYGVEFLEGPDGMGVYASRDVEPLRCARVIMEIPLEPMLTITKASVDANAICTALSDRMGSKMEVS
ncbi:hypothetical protein GUJ93_ZPchr0010g9884 [Zizania palustris]|uniref:Uncharacterized protein n=1 Tax=Zizania palustris TaxID=103762 RepID=A0A8J5WBY7_ZIZPA|nr:hypothetical protein GUJ93_ZPchr0010g9884 [Zizania palustris]